MKIVIGGDTHGDSNQIAYLFNVAKGNNCKLIIQVGDFGYWPKSLRGQQYLEMINRLATKTKIDFYWLDGNHEDHNSLDKWRVGKFTPIDTEYFTKKDHFSFPHLKYLPRGSKFDIDGCSFMAMGGAYSIDRYWEGRKKDVTWFDNEIVDHELIESLPDEHVDVLLSHDMPQGLLKWPYNDKETISMIASNGRLSLDLLVKKVTPRFCFGGHHHFRAVYPVEHRDGHAEAHVLHCNGAKEKSWFIFDTAWVSSVD